MCPEFVNMMWQGFLQNLYNEVYGIHRRESERDAVLLEIIIMPYNNN